LGARVIVPRKSVESGKAVDLLEAGDALVRLCGWRELKGDTAIIILLACGLEIEIGERDFAGVSGRQIEEILKDGQNARLFTPGDEASLSAALTAMIDDPASALAMAARARNMIVECGYQWVNNAIRVIKLVESSSSERQLK